MVVCCLLGGLFLCGGWYGMDVKDWYEFEHINNAMKYVGQQPDATGFVIPLH